MRNIMFLALLFVTKAALASDPYNQCIWDDEDNIHCTYFAGMQENKFISMELTLPWGETILLTDCATPDFALTFEDDLYLGHYEIRFAFRNNQGQFDPVPTMSTFDVYQHGNIIKATPEFNKIKVHNFQDPMRYPTCDLEAANSEEVNMDYPQWTEKGAKL